MSLKIQLSNKDPEVTQTSALVVIVDSDPEESPLLKSLDKQLGGGLFSHFKALDFQWDKGAALHVPSLGRGPAAHLLFVGLKASDGGDGARFTPGANLAHAIGSGVRASLVFQPTTINVAAPAESSARALALGAALGAYKFEKYMTSSGRNVALRQVTVMRPGAISPSDKREFALGLGAAQGVSLARDLVNEPPNVLTPEELGNRARAVAKRGGLTAKILDHKAIVKAGMNLHYAVGKGSDNLPTFIHLTYRPARPKGRVAFVGKGITFDSGGLCIKPPPSMPEMKTDMAGAAAVLGLMEAVSALAPDVEVHGIVGAAENMPDARAYRPSDVITALNGKGVEIINTDAEGRLVLADALTYAARLEPDFIVDAATLTGATLISLGSPYSAFYTGSANIVRAMQEASAEAGESFWHMPLIEELAAQLKSDITDLKHTGDRFGGAITAALFLREFTAGVPWMHCDIPGPVFRERPSGMHPKGGTGHGVLTFLSLVEAHDRKPIEKAKAKTETEKAPVSRTRKKPSAKPRSPSKKRTAR